MCCLPLTAPCNITVVSILPLLLLLAGMAEIVRVRRRGAGKLLRDRLRLGRELGFRLSRLLLAVDRGLVLGDGREVEPVDRNLSVPHHKT